ncbi:MAG: AMP-binding protein, partial [Eubacterium sp.]|nr:AMP-binding protein [Candidatus Colimonas fimequi]
MSKSFYELLLERNKSYEDGPALCQMMKTGNLRTINYSEMYKLIDKYYDVLKSTGDYQPGDRIGICGAASPEWVIAFFAISKIGCTVACIDHTYPTSEMQKITKKAQLRGIFMTDATYPVLQDPLDGVNFYRLEDASVISTAERNPETPVVYPEAGILIFSSGTTSTAAGILHEAENIVWPVDHILVANGVNTHNERFMAFLPNSHIYGTCGQLIAPILYGCPACYLEELSAACILGAFEAFQPTIFLGVPKVYELLQGNIDSKIHAKKATSMLFNALFPLCLKLRQKTGINLGQYIFKAVKDGLGGRADVMLNGGAPLNKETAEFYFGVGLRPLNTYGATETSVPTLGNFGKNITMDTCGRPYKNVEFKISEDGEMLIRSPYLMIGYFNEPERTAGAYTDDGWFKSGDLIELDEHDNIVIKGRAKENIVLSTGKKVGPDEIEFNYTGLPGVKDYTVSGIPVEGGYDEVHAFVVAADGVSEAEVEKAFMDKSADSPLIMKLQGVHFMDEIPRTAVGKPKRFVLRKMVMEGKDLKSSAPAPKVDKNESTIEEKVYYAVQKVTGASEFTDDSRLFHDLALDSLSAIQLCTLLEDLTGVRVDDHTDKNSTVGDVIAVVKNPPAGSTKKKDNRSFPLEKTATDMKILRWALNIVKSRHHVTVSGIENIPAEGGYVLCANHVSNFDFLYLTCHMDDAKFEHLGTMAKQELFKDKFFNNMLCRMGGMIPIDRGGSVADSMAVIDKKLNEGWGIVAFPEGTRSTSGKLIEFKHGPAMLAFNAGVPIVPCYTEGGFEAYPNTQALP